MNQPRSDLTIDSILSLPAGEHSWVDFKGTKRLDLLNSNDCQKYISSISTDLCAFANSGGGTLILGIDEDKKTGAREISCGGIPSIRGRERMLKWFQDTLPNCLDPKLSDFDIYEITSGDGLDAGKSIYVVEIRSSSRAPHQVRGSGVYYGRTTDKAEPLPHQFVLDILNRKMHPELDIIFRYDDIARPNEIVATIRNRGRVPARLVNVQIWMHPLDRMMPSSELKLAVFEAEYWRMFEFDLGPILPMRNRKVTIPTINAGPVGIRAKWNISTDSAPIVEGEVSLDEEHLLKKFDLHNPNAQLK